MKHGHKTRGYTSPTYRTWSHMVERCTCVTSDKYKDYGARGITVCERWLKFENFLTDMGERPADLTLDRVDNGKGYSPDNCAWATKSQQAKNRRAKSTLRKIDGKTVAEWARHYNRKHHTIAKRIRKHGSPHL